MKLRLASIIFYELSILVALDELVSGVAHISRLAFVFDAILIVFICKLPSLCRLSNAMLFFMGIIAWGQIVCFHLSLIHSAKLPANVYVTLFGNNSLIDLLCYLLICVFFARNRYSGPIKKLQIDLHKENLKKSINNISDVEDLLLKISPYAVTISKSDTSVLVKILDTLSDHWIDISINLKSNILVIISSEKILKAICYQILSRTRANFIVEFAPYNY